MNTRTANATLAQMDRASMSGCTKGAIAPMGPPCDIKGDYHWPSARDSEPKFVMHSGCTILRVIHRATGRTAWATNGQHFGTVEEARVAVDARLAAIDARRIG